MTPLHPAPNAPSLLIDEPLDLSKPVQIVDGKPAEASADVSLEWWLGGAWVIVLLTVGWIAWLRHRNRFGAMARLGRIMAGWRGVDAHQFAAMRAIAHAEMKESAERPTDSEVREEICRMLLLPRHAAGVLDRAWDRTQGPGRANLIVLRGKLGVLDPGANDTATTVDSAA